ncbi:hypothetical protein [Gordonia sp. (in: high G+C Gram-positive bacteria)]|uniref:hypothetical protein n=1 Tax=Gordonia sp. (in: high G+C Gram-positive bacteria) TaxID=84139 RepID=UPI0016AB2DD8|nr:hypothetical protein [Gordonia sp. (in: high G+C Gram-positive bacteria)]NLG46266.1 hypothetical protein [Gordonia sp. (in: high G+C Gram-positive bacteria)]
MTEVYRFQVEGRLSADLLTTFQPLQSTDRAGSTVFWCAFVDRAQLFGAIARCELLGLALVSLTRTGFDAIR